MAQIIPLNYYNDTGITFANWHTYYQTGSSAGANNTPVVFHIAAKSNGVLALGIGTETSTSSYYFQMDVDVQGYNSPAPKITLASAPNPSVFGQSVTFTSTVSPATSGLPTPTGTVTFMDGLIAIGTGKLNSSGLATFSTSALPIGSDPITAVYGGDTNFSSNTSAPVTQVVNGQQFNIHFPSFDYQLPLIQKTEELDSPIPLNIDVQLQEFDATFTEIATSPKDPGAIGSATGNTNTNGGKPTQGRFIEFGPLSFVPTASAFTTTQVTVTLFQAAPNSVALGSPPPPDSQKGTIDTGAKNVWLNTHNASDEVLEWYTTGFSTYKTFLGGSIKRPW